MATERNGAPPYLDELGLDTDPFPVTPTLTRFFPSRRTYQGYRELLHLIERRKGFMLVTGEVGVGKTTLMHRLMHDLERAGERVALILHGVPQERELIAAIHHGFGLAELPPPQFGIQPYFEALHRFFSAEQAAGRNCVLILDDAQNLDAATLELVRQLSNLETSDTKLVQVVLVAQPEILDLLGRFEMRQLNSRITLHVQLTPLDRAETRGYVLNRLDQAGAAQRITLTGAALRRLQHASGGLPRRINLIMDRCLYGLLQRPRLRIDRRLMTLAIAETETGLRTHRAAVAHAPRWRLALLLTLLLGALAALGWSRQQQLLPWLETQLMPQLAALGARLPSTDAEATAPQGTTTDTEPAASIDTDVAMPMPAPQTSPADTDTQPASPAVADATGADLAALIAAYPTLFGMDATEDAGEAGDGPMWVAWRSHETITENCQGRPALTLGDGERLSFYRTGIAATQPTFGERSPAARQLQERLAALGHLAPDAVDGIMGRSTLAALRAFQSARGLAASGVIDPPTRYQLSCPSP
ncbi:ExeA family protein [Marichromatium bheemlicum]|uniref:AAA family ATPase n=1 Tax=Marichromatium bheemlicum TaxID=365339 RepID=A0ABX1I829_9GAMM|nr:ExeA family protein [Marichromatium bheemlicum]NKN32382.1 AAA family ATPase [Marichromatium bheemlicum]